MATHKSAKKRARQDLKRRERNRDAKSAVRTAIKKFRLASASGDADQAEATLRFAESQIRRAASKGVIPRTTASRQVARLSMQKNRDAASATS